MLFERRTLVVRIATLHDQRLFRPTTVRRRRIAPPLGPRASPRRAVIAIGCISVMSMSLSRIHGLANAVNAVRGEGHDPGDLLDFELLAGPAQAFAQRTDRRHHGTARTAGTHAAPATSPAALATTPPAAGTPTAARTTTARTTRAARAGDRGVDQSLR